MSRGARVLKRSEWLDRLRRFGRSKLSVSEFCRREQVSVPSYYQWRRKLADAISEVDVGEQPATFIPVQVTSRADLEVTFPNGVRLTLAAGDRPHIELLIESIALARTTQGGA